MLISDCIIVLEYSVSQKAFHRTTLQGMIDFNLKLISNRKSVDFIPIGLFLNHEACDCYYKIVEPIIRFFENPENAAAFDRLEYPELSNTSIEDLIREIGK